MIDEEDPGVADALDPLQVAVSATLIATLADRVRVASVALGLADTAAAARR